MMVSVQEKAHQHITLDASHCKATTSFNWKNKRKVRNMHVLCSISRNSFHYKRYYLFIHTTPFCTIYYTTKQESTCSSPFPLGFGFLWEALKPPTPSIPHKSTHSGVLCGVDGPADVQVSFGGMTPRNNLSSDQSKLKTMQCTPHTSPKGNSVYILCTIQATSSHYLVLC